MMDLGFKDKVALVTGAGSQVGFGKAISVTLAKEGCDVIVVDINMEGAQKTASEIKSLGRQSMAVKVDLTNRADVNDMVKTISEKFNKIDILVNNAGAISALKPFMERTEAEWDLDINLNLKGVMYCTRAVLNGMIARKYGKIINISSIGAKKGKRNTSTYGAAKAGVIGFTQNLAVELAGQGINVNCIAPGLGVTGFAGGSPPPEIMEKALETIPVKRTTTPQDIANTVVFLASDISSDIVGQTISVDGGESII
jgi:NAD(P)-dependent dehydrogenase (short-subunit alcohol dehydrogenase family)